MRALFVLALAFAVVGCRKGDREAAAASPALILPSGGRAVALSWSQTDVTVREGATAVVLSMSVPATADGFLVTLSSGDPGRLIVPASVLIPAGSSRAEIVLNALPDDDDRNDVVTVTAISPHGNVALHVTILDPDALVAVPAMRELAVR